MIQLYNVSLVAGDTIDLVLGTGGDGFFSDNTPVNLQITPALSGDYNHNGKVDAADYVLWRKSPATYGGNPAGYNTWRANFGQPPGSGLAAAVSASAAVPNQRPAFYCSRRSPACHFCDAGRRCRLKKSLVCKTHRQLTVVTRVDDPINSSV